ncbi:MAG TPA: hypothetical protein PKK95_01000 [Vicinamibacterales bacterium]|nr:hypothetical protein [Acidobacteriota bacterium]HOC16809.1 hypothetical protein [Vicinamibacterales bacterium]
MRLSLAAPVVAAWLAAASPCLAASQGPGLPQLEWRAPEALAPQVERLARFDTGRLLAVMRLVGLEEAGPPIPVVLVPEDAPLARDTPQWIAGFATGGRAVVLFPARTPSYPYDSVDQLLQHEIAHVLIARAAGGRLVPRWFHEGVALAAERAWTLGDRAQFAIDVAFGGRIAASSLDGLFEGDVATVRRAYRLSGLLVEDLLRTHGSNLPAQVLSAMRGGLSFDAAFETSTGMSVDEASRAFWRRRRFWAAWLPWLTSATALWTLITLLALAAIARVAWRRKRRKWEEEEEDEIE